MTRPPGISDEMVAAWVAEALADPPEGIPRAMLNIPLIREVYCAGSWLGGMLERAAADQETNDAICFSAGQKMMFAANPWDVAQAALAQFTEDGCFDEPGAALAERLNREHMNAGRAES